MNSKIIFWPLALSLLFIPITTIKVQADYKAGLSAYQVSDYETAYKELITEADWGNADAQYYIGNMYWIGDGVVQSDEEAVKWYRKAAERGHSKAETVLSEIFDINIPITESPSGKQRIFRSMSGMELVLTSIIYLLGLFLCFFVLPWFIIKKVVGIATGRKPKNQ